MEILKKTSLLVKLELVVQILADENKRIFSDIIVHILSSFSITPANPMLMLKISQMTKTKIF